MNCKPGDLAIVVKANRVPENVGRIVKVVRLVSRGEVLFSSGCVNGTAGWLVEGRVRSFLGFNGNEGVFPDNCLRPIRDPGDDAQDEMLVLLGKPEQVTA